MKNQIFLRILQRNLAGIHCHFEFRPKRNSFSKLDAAIDAALSKAEAVLDSYYDRLALLGIEKSVRSREFDRMHGTLLVSLHSNGRYTPIVTHAIQFEFFCELVGQLEDPKPAEPARMKRYLQETSKQAPDNPIFFKMVGTVPSERDRELGITENK